MPNVTDVAELVDGKTILEDMLTNNERHLDESHRKYVQFRIDNLPEMFDFRPVNRIVFERMVPTSPDYLVWLRCKQPIVGELFIFFSIDYVCF